VLDMECKSALRCHMFSQIFCSCNEIILFSSVNVCLCGPIRNAFSSARLVTKNDI
jgi:hypothetical protein